MESHTWVRPNGFGQDNRQAFRVCAITDTSSVSAGTFVHIIAENNASFYSSFQKEFLSMSSEFTFDDNSDKLSILQFF